MEAERHILSYFLAIFMRLKLLEIRVRVFLEMDWEKKKDRLCRTEE